MTMPDALLTPAIDRPATALPRTLGGALVGGLLIATIEFAATRDTVTDTLHEQFGWLLRLSAHWALAAIPLGIAIGILERRSWLRPVAAPAYAVAVLLGAISGALVLALHGKYVDPAISVTAVGFDMALPDRFLYGLWQLGFWGSVGAILHATNLRQRRGIVALRAGELARLRSERSLSEARLAALHARVEPEFLLSTLQTVERLYATDTAAADRVLDALIEFLREATPLLRQQSSTIGQECRLLQSYARALGAASGTCETVRVELGWHTERTAIPPGTVISLAQWLLGALPTDGTGPALEVRAHPGSVGTVLELSTTMARGVELAGLYELTGRIVPRLRASCGAACSVAVLRDDPDRLTLRLSVIGHQETAHERTAGH
jgi:hypothetical protein